MSTRDCLQSVIGLLHKCFDADVAKRPSALACEEALTKVFQWLSVGAINIKFPPMTLQPRDFAFFGYSSAFTNLKPKECLALYFGKVLGDPEKQADLQEEQMADELHDALQAACWGCGRTDGAAHFKACSKCKQLKLVPCLFCSKECLRSNWPRHKAWHHARLQQGSCETIAMRTAMKEALKAGQTPSKVLRANPLFLQTVGAELASNPKNKLLPLMVDWVSAMSRLESHKVAPPLLVAMVEHTQAVWARMQGVSMKGASKRCCSHRLNISDDSRSPFARMCEEGALEVLQGVLSSAAARETAGDQGAVAALNESKPQDGSMPWDLAWQNGHFGAMDVLDAYGVGDVRRSGVTAAEGDWLPRDQQWKICQLNGIFPSNLR